MAWSDAVSGGSDHLLEQRLQYTSRRVGHLPKPRGGPGSEVSSYTLSCQQLPEAGARGGSVTPSGQPDMEWSSFISDSQRERGNKQK